jgi:hypothetical protein
MNIVVKSALTGAALVVAYACATPVEISDDVLRSNPSDFGDGGLPLAGTGGGAGAAQGGSGGSGVPAGGSGAGVGGASAGAGMQVSAGAGGLPIGVGGTGGAGAGGATAQGGVGGTAAGAGGAPGTAGAAGAAGTAGNAGTTGTGAVGTFDPAACDFEDVTGCETLTCLAACSTTDGGSCRTRCEALITCVSTDADCVISEADPLCAVRNGGTPNACTQQADSAGGAATTQTTQPAFVAREFVECICSVPRP